MSPSIKLGLLSIVSAAAAVPHNGGHSRFHGSGGYGQGTGLPGTGLSAPYPTGGWGGSHNHTRHGPTGSGAKTTTLLQTQHSTETVVSTVYATRPGGGGGGGNGAASSAGALGGASSAAVCGPATVTVTATNKVTVTVPAGGAPASSAAGSSAAASSSAQAVEVPSSSQAQPVSPSTQGGYASPPPAAASSASSAVIEKVPSVSVSLDHKQPTYVPPASSAATSAAAVPSKPASSAASKPASSAASSAAQPSSTGSTGAGAGYPSEKRGLAWNDVNLLQSFINTGKFGWTYNWESKVHDGNKVPGNTEFIPTLHPLSLKDAFAGNVKGAKRIFTFNEPDKGDQANFLPTKENCDTYWNSIVGPIIQGNSGMTIVAPSVSNGNMSVENGKVTLNAGKQGPAQGLYWLELFKAACPKAAAAWSEINIHYYDDWDNKDIGTVARFKGYYNLAAELNPGKKIWVTEIGLNPASLDHTSEFIPEVTKFLDSQSTCAGYSYFKVGTGANQLADASSGAGQKYSS